MSLNRALILAAALAAAVVAVAPDAKAQNSAPQIANTLVVPSIANGQSEAMRQATEKKRKAAAMRQRSEVPAEKAADKK